MEREIPATVIAMAVLVIIASGIIILTLMDSQETDQPVPSGTGIKANPAAPVTTGITTTETPRLPIVNNVEENAIPQLREGFPHSNITASSNSPTDSYHRNVVNECALVPFKDANNPLADGFTYENITVFNSLSAGNYSSPFGKEVSRITIEQAKDFVRKAFPNYSPDRIDMEFSEGYSFREWEFDLHKDDKQLIQGSLDAKTGELMYYLIPSFYWEDTQKQSNPAITMESARLTAENEIRERNGKLHLKLMDSQVNLYGNYDFNYRRIIHGVPSLNNGIWVGIDARTGKVGSYSKRWEVPEDAVAASSVPAISREEAIAVVEREATACYPESAYSFRIVSADLQWMDSYPSDKFIPKPGVIPLAWHVRFNDKTIRAQDLHRTDDGWVDAQNGTLLSMSYFHHR